MQAGSKLFQKGRRRGVTLIEAALTLGVVAILLVGLTQMLSGAAETTRARAVADRLQQVTAASKAYIQANFADLFEQVESGMVPVTMDTLKQGGFLPASFSDRNAYNQTHVLLLKQTGDSANPRLEGIVTTEGGSNIPDRQLGQIASFAGAEAGFMMDKPVSGTTNVITGIGGGWTAPSGDWGNRPKAGRVMATVAYNEGILVGDYLNRNDIGIPEANTMRTNLNMAAGECAVPADCGAINNVSNLTNQASTINLAEKVTIGPNLEVAGYITAGTDVTGKRFVDRDNASFYVDPNGKSKVQALDANYLNMDAGLYTGATPPAPGTAVTLLKDRLPDYVQKGGYYVEGFTTRVDGVPKPTCGTGGTPKILMTPVTDNMVFKSNVTATGSGDNIVINNGTINIARGFQAVDSGGGWAIEISGTPLIAARGWKVFASTYCYYGT